MARPPTLTGIPHLTGTQAQLFVILARAQQAVLAWGQETTGLTPSPAVVDLLMHLRAAGKLAKALESDT